MRTFAWRQSNPVSWAFRLIFLTVLVVNFSFSAKADVAEKYIEAFQNGVIYLRINGIDPVSRVKIKERSGTGFFISYDQQAITTRHLFRVLQASHWKAYK
jgi:hypothetical protein